MDGSKTPDEWDLEKIRALLKGPFSGWALGALLAIFMAFIIDVLKWTYDGPAFRYPHGVLSLLGVWLLCFWAVTLARKLLAAKP